jgi:hypothetical protein
MAPQNTAKCHFHNEQHHLFIQWVTRVPHDFPEDFAGKLAALLTGKSRGPLRRGCSSAHLQHARGHDRREASASDGGFRVCHEGKRAECFGRGGAFRSRAAKRTNYRHFWHGNLGRPLRGQRSTASATPIPPPIQRLARPFRASRRAISCSKVTRIRHPDAPIG